MIDKFWESNLLRALIFAPRTYFLSNHILLPFYRGAQLPLFLLRSSDLTLQILKDKWACLWESPDNLECQHSLRLQWHIVLMGQRKWFGWAITSPPVSAAQVSVKTVPWAWAREIGEEQVQREAQAGCRCGSIIPPRVVVVHPVGYTLLTVTTSFMLTHVVANLFSVIPKKTKSGPGIEIRECHVCFSVCSDSPEPLGPQIKRAPRKWRYLGGYRLLPG